MAYDESIYRRDTGNVDSTGVGGYDESRYPGGQSYPDDPEHGVPGRDRIGVHVGWELLLLLGVGALGWLLYRQNPGVSRGAELDRLLVLGTALGLLALGASLSLRAGVPNLALGPAALAAAVYSAENGDREMLAATGPALIAAVALGLAVAVLVVGFHVPAWASSLAAAFGVVVFIQQRPGQVTLWGGYETGEHARYLFGGFAAITVLAGLFGTIRPIRRSVGRFRAVGDPARRRGAGAGIVATLALVLSSVFAVLAGVLLAGSAGAALLVDNPGGPNGLGLTGLDLTGLDLTGLALGMALLGGTSAFGRRGGIFGTGLAVVLLTLFTTYANERNWDGVTYPVAGVMVAAGLVVTRLVEACGGPRSAGTRDDGWDDPGTTVASDWRSAPVEPPEPWSTTLPAQPAEGDTDPWGPDRWGGRDR